MQSDAIKGHDCETASAEIRRAKGCYEPLPEHLRWQCMGHTFDRCPNFYLRESAFIQESLEVYAWREKGFLPFPGGWIEQPNLCIEVLEFMDQLVHYKASAEKKMADSMRKGKV